MTLPSSPALPAAPAPLDTLPAWQALRAHQAGLRDLHLREAFDADPGRAQRMSLSAAGLFADCSKHRIDDRGLALLADLARARGLEANRDAMLGGAKINVTEGRAVLHTALRAPAGVTIPVDGRDVVADVHAVQARMRAFAARVRDGAWTGHDGRPITDVINIGIGGSDLGPAMACEALSAFGHPRLRMHFVSNVDGAHLARALATVDPATTLFIVVSKTFTTQETLANARSARDWLLRQPGVPAQAVAKHFVAVSTNEAEVRGFGIDPANMFGFWDWVGGRFSMWSAVGLSLMLSIGAEGFDALLTGARAMDEHFAQAPLETNLPVRLALLGVWYRDLFGWGSHAVVPYAQDLARLPAYLQQLEMESNGKTVTLAGDDTTVPTCPVIWGEPGTNGQHAFFQLLHQGTDPIPVDFIVAREATRDLPGHQRLLIANCLAQSAALMRGKTTDEAAAEMRAAGMAADRVAQLAAHRTFPGNRPSTTIVLPRLDPHALGALLALYEHKTFVQGVIWGLNPFDQWGVELGKQLASQVAAGLGGQTGALAGLDASTRALVARLAD